MTPDEFTIERIRRQPPDEDNLFLSDVKVYNVSSPIEQKSDRPATRTRSATYCVQQVFVEDETGKLECWVKFVNPKHAVWLNDRISICRGQVRITDERKLYLSGWLMDQPRRRTATAKEKDNAENK